MSAADGLKKVAEEIAKVLKQLTENLSAMAGKMPKEMQDAVENFQQEVGGATGEPAYGSRNASTPANSASINTLRPQPPAPDRSKILLAEQKRREEEERELAEAENDAENEEENEEDKIKNKMGGLSLVVTHMALHMLQQRMRPEPSPEEGSAKSKVDDPAKNNSVVNRNDINSPVNEANELLKMGQELLKAYKEFKLLLEPKLELRQDFRPELKDDPTQQNRQEQSQLMQDKLKPEVTKPVELAKDINTPDEPVNSTSNSPSPAAQNTMGDEEIDVSRIMAARNAGKNAHDSAVSASKTPSLANPKPMPIGGKPSLTMDNKLKPDDPQKKSLLGEKQSNAVGKDPDQFSDIFGPDAKSDNNPGGPSKKPGNSPFKTPNPRDGMTLKRGE